MATRSEPDQKSSLPRLNQFERQNVRGSHHGQGSRCPTHRPDTFTQTVQSIASHACQTGADHTSFLTERPAGYAFPGSIVDQQLELPVLVLELLHPPQLANAKPAVNLHPAIVCLLRNAHPADNFRHRRARLRLPQGAGKLLLSDLKQARISSAKMSGCSSAAKWPPLGG